MQDLLPKHQRTVTTQVPWIMRPFKYTEQAKRNLNIHLEIWTHARIQDTSLVKIKLACKSRYFLGLHCAATTANEFSIIGMNLMLKVASDCGLSVHDIRTASTLCCPPRSNYSVFRDICHMVTTNRHPRIGRNTDMPIRDTSTEYLTMQVHTITARTCL